jgi:hypothetical protein
VPDGAGAVLRTPPGHAGLARDEFALNRFGILESALF